MRIQDKFSTILKTNKLGIKSIHGLEKYCKVGIGSISKFLNVGESPSLGTIKKVQEALSINTDWWETGEGEIYDKKGTYVDLPTRKEKDPDEHIRILIKNLDRMGELNEYLLKELKRLQGG